MPQNGIFAWGEFHKFRDVRDGLSNTLAFCEFVQLDRPVNGSTFAVPPGNVRPWILGGTSSDGTYGSYAFKILEHPPNSHLNRTGDGVPFNHLEMGSHHPGGMVVAFGDGSVSFMEENIERNTYKALGTAAGGEIVNYP